MSDYARQKDFSVKDGLTSGDPNKKILGSDVDAELDAVLTAVNSKADTAGDTFTGQVTHSGTLIAGGQFRQTKGADLASATNVTLGAGNYFDVTGTTTIAGIANTQNGTVVRLHFDSSLTLTHSSTFVMPNAIDLVVGAGDELELVQFDTAAWRVTRHLRATGIDFVRISEVAIGTSITQVDLTWGTSPRDILIRWNGVRPTSDDEILRIRYKQGASIITSTDYAYTLVKWDSAGSVGQIQGAPGVATFIAVSGLVGNASNEATYGEATLYDVQRAGFQNMKATSTFIDGSLNHLVGLAGGSLHIAAPATGASLLWSGGDFTDTTGSIELWARF